MTAPDRSTRYPLDVALSVASGRLLCSDFADVHAMMTDLAGWPVMTHHLANEQLANAAAAKVIDAASWMPGAIENMPTWSTDDPGQARAEIAIWIAMLTDLYGDTVTVPAGDPLPTLELFAGLERIGGGDH